MAKTLVAPSDTDFLANMAWIDKLVAYAGGSSLTPEDLRGSPLTVEQVRELFTARGKVAAGRWSRIYSQSIESLVRLRRHYVAGAPLSGEDLERMKRSSRQLIELLGRSVLPG